jgi:two-component system response regulator DevR
VCADAASTPPAGEMIRVFLVEGHDLVRRGLYELLLDAGSFTIVGATATADEALRRIPVEKPDVVLLDVSVPDGSGIEVCRAIRDRYPSIRVLMLTTCVDHEVVLASVLAGASGFALKQIRNQALVEAVRSVATCTSLLLLAEGTGVVGQLALPTRPDGALAGLSRQERHVLDSVVEGLTNRQISLRFGIAQTTVTNHVSSLFAKLAWETPPRQPSDIRSARARSQRLGHHGSRP